MFGASKKCFELHEWTPQALIRRHQKFIMEARIVAIIVTLVSSRCASLEVQVDVDNQRCDLETISRDIWRDMHPLAFAKVYGKQNKPLLLKRALQLTIDGTSEATQASKWSPDFLATKLGTHTLADLPRAFLPETAIAFGGAVAIEDSTHAELFAKLRPLTPIFHKHGPLSRLRGTQLLFVAPPGAGFGLHSHAWEDGYNLLLQGAPQRWVFLTNNRRLAENISQPDAMVFANSCPQVQNDIVSSNSTNRLDIALTACVQHPGDAIWIPAGIQHAVCTTSDAKASAVSTGGRGDYGGWTNVMLAARDGSIPLLQRALNVKSMSGNGAREIKKSVINGPNRSLTTAVHLAASRGHTRALEWLLKRGGEVGPAQIPIDLAKSQVSLAGRPHPHHVAATHGHLAALQVLVAHRADVTASLGRYSGNAYDLARRAGHTLIVRWLSEQTARDERQGQLEL